MVLLAVPTFELNALSVLPLDADRVDPLPKPLVHHGEELDDRNEL